MDKYQFSEMLENEAKSYLDDAERGMQRDWAEWDDEDTADAIVAIWSILNMNAKSLGYAEKYENCELLELERVARCREVIRGLMKRAAYGHANRVMQNRKD